MNLKKIIGVFLIGVAVLLFLLVTNFMLVVFMDTESKQSIISTVLVFAIFYVVNFIVFRFGRKLYRQEAAATRTDILDTSDMLVSTEHSLSKNSFSMNPEGFKEVQSAIIKRIIPIGILAIGGGIAMGFFKSSSSVGFDWNVLFIMIPISVLAIGYGMKRGIDRQRQIFDSYVLSINEWNIERRAYNTPTIKMAHADINAILKNEDGSFLIKSATSTDIIGILAQIERKDELEKLLQEIHPITTEAPKSLLEKYRTLLTILPIGLMVVTFLSTHKWTVGIAGSLLLIAMGYSFFELQRNKNVDEKSRSASWWILVVVLAVLGTMYSKIMMG